MLGGGHLCAHCGEFLFLVVSYVRKKKLIKLEHELQETREFDNFMSRELIFKLYRKRNKIIILIGTGCRALYFACRARYCTNVSSDLRSIQ